MNTTITTVLVSDPALQEACDAIGRDTVIRLAQELTSARRKYPGFALNHAEAVDVVESEFLEWKAQAMRVNSPKGLNTERRNKAEGEAFHLITTALRYVRREYEGHPLF